MTKYLFLVFIRPVFGTEGGCYELIVVVWLDGRGESASRKISSPFEGVCRGTGRSLGPRELFDRELCFNSGRLFGERVAEDSLDSGGLILRRAGDACYELGSRLTVFLISGEWF